MIGELKLIFHRDLDTLARAIALYPDDATLWTPVPGQPTAGGNLALHLFGNLRHFIGATLGGTGYVRQRELEFSTRGRSRESLIEELRLTRSEMDEAFANLDPARLDQPFPADIGGVRPSIRLVLIHLATHLAFHMGQLDYHRRAASGDRASAAPMGLQALVP
ncbi:MAG TPA: DinB family protein [Holophagaceae bacterium]|nr:DinB family protein [Holophagaceae bacterium]